MFVVGLVLDRAISGVSSACSLVDPQLSQFYA